MDKKSDHYTSAEGYRDLDGNHKTFTFVDHDIKTKGFKPVSEEEISEARTALKTYREQLIDKIRLLPAVHSAKEHQEFVKRGELGITWNETMLKDPGTSLDLLRDIYTIASNRSITL